MAQNLVTRVRVSSAALNPEAQVLSVYFCLPRLKVKISRPRPGRFRNNHISLPIGQFPFAKRKNVHFLPQLSVEHSSARSAGTGATVRGGGTG